MTWFILSQIFSTLLKLLRLGFTIGTRQVYLADVTNHPNGHWITQQARNQVWTFQEQEDQFCGLIRDNDKKFPQTFDDVFESEGIHIIRIPYQSPNANA